MTRPELLPYRENVAAVVVNAAGAVLVGWKHGGWVLPQGGVDKAEDIESALRRELAEEIGTSSFHIVRQACHVHCYDWPPGTVSGAKRPYRGQRQHYFLVAFDGSDSDLKPETTGELAQLEWLPPAEVVRQAWKPKRPGYLAAFREFGLIT